MLSFIFRTVLGVFWRARAEGLENIPQTGRLIIVSNHLSNIDPPLLGGFAAKRRLSKYVIKKSLLKTPLMGKWFKEFGFIAVDRTDASKDMGAFKAMIAALKKEEALTIFPEGTRSKNGKPGEAKAGVSFIAHKTNSPVLIARVFNTFGFPRRSKLRVVFGPVIKFEAVEGKDIKEQYEDFAKKIMTEIQNIK